MRKLLTSILLLLIVNINVAQDSSKTNDDILRHGLQFQVTALLALTNFDNYTISYRYLLNNSLGLRIGLYTNLNDQTNNTNEKRDSVNLATENIFNLYNFKFSTQVIHRLLSYNDFSLVVGGGPFISNYGKESSTRYTEYQNEVSRTTKEKGFGYGLDLIFGVEYNLSKNVVISGEYGLTIEKSNKVFERIEKIIAEDPEHNHIRETKRDEFDIVGMGVNLGISVFF